MILKNASKLKQPDRDSLQRDLEAFLNRGGEIVQLPTYVTADPALLSVWDPKAGKMRSKRQGGDE